MAERQKEFFGTLVTIGDEILLGDIPNGNAHHISSALRAEGFRLRSIVTVGDNEDDLIECLEQGLDKSSFLIVTGGLGPTEDDRTIAAVTKVFDLPLATDHVYRDHLQKLLASKGRTWTQELDKMVQLPAGSVKLGVDMAGFRLEHRNVPCYFLPGVPQEMQQLLSEEVIPDLRHRFPRHSAYVKHVLRIQGLPESAIGRRLRGVSFRELGIEIGYLPQQSENWVTLLAVAETEEIAHSRLDRAQQTVIACMGREHVSGVNDENLEKVVGRQLMAKTWRMAAAESCTGGLLSSRITAIPGASDYFERAFVTYSNQAKMEMLNVPEKMLEQYGAVSRQVAEAMAGGARKEAGVDIAVAITGIAGPTGGSPEKPVGTVFIACSTSVDTYVEKHLFAGSRGIIQTRSAHAALVLLWRILSKC